jgi:hypothetical protein
MLRRKWLRRTLIVLGATLAAVEILYLVAANIYLNTGKLPELVSRPGKLSIRWGTAFTVLPGLVHLRDVDVRGRTRKRMIDWYVHADSVSASCRLLPLFDRVVHLRSVSTSGAEYKQRPKVDPAEDASGFPTMPDLEPPPDAVPGPPKPKKEPWTIIADDIDADMKQIWFDRYRLAGEMNVRTPMRLVVRGPLEFPKVRFKMTRGDLTMNERAIMGAFDLDVETALPSFVPKGVKAIDLLRSLDGRFQVRSESASLFFLEEYFKQTPWLRFHGRSALDADLYIEAGGLRTGSKLEAISENLDVDFIDRKLTGRGRVSVEVEDVGGTPQSRLEILLDEFALAVPTESKPHARGRGFRVTASSSELGLEKPFMLLSVVADLPDAVIEDVGFYNRYVPAATGLAIRKGTGTIAYHIEATREEGAFHGWMDLSVRDLSMQFHSYEILGHVKIHTILDSARIKDRLFDVSGTTIDLESLKFPWTATATLTKAQVRYSEPLEVRADAEIRMTDTTPLVALFDAQKDVSGFVERMMKVKDIHGRASIGVDDGGSEITDVEIGGEKLLALADLALRKSGKDGILYIRFHGFSVGVAFDKGKKDIDLVRAKSWYEKQRAKRRPRPSGG